jgi:hypothetical protein
MKTSQYTKLAKPNDPKTKEFKEFKRIKQNFGKDNVLSHFPQSIPDFINSDTSQYPC